MADPREEAWDAVHEALPAPWNVGPPTYDPGIVGAPGQLGAFSVTARAPHPGRGKQPLTVTRTGDTEEEALRDLDGLLRGSGMPAGRMDDLRARLRLAYVSGAEAWTQRELGRGMTGEELKRVNAGYEGR
jgi:hypothetical protein